MPIKAASLIMANSCLTTKRSMDSDDPFSLHSGHSGCSDGNALVSSNYTCYTIPRTPFLHVGSLGSQGVFLDRWLRPSLRRPDKIWQCHRILLSVCLEYVLLHSEERGQFWELKKNCITTQRQSNPCSTNHVGQQQSESGDPFCSPTTACQPTRKDEPLANSLRCVVIFLVTCI